MIISTTPSNPIATTTASLSSPTSAMSSITDIANSIVSTTSTTATVTVPTTAAITTTATTTTADIDITTTATSDIDITTTATTTTTDIGIATTATTTTDITTTTNIDITTTATTTTTDITTTTDAASAPTTTSTTVTNTPISPATDTSSSSDSTNIVIAVAIIVVILLIAIVVTVVIMVYYWKKRWSSYHIYDNNNNNDIEHDEEPPLSPLYASVDVKEKKSTDGTSAPNNVAYNQKPPLNYAVVNKKEKNGKRRSMEPQSIELDYKPERTSGISIQSQEPTFSVVNPDYEQTRFGNEQTKFDLFSSAPDIPERTKDSHGMVYNDKEEENPIYNINENPIYSEAFNPAAIVADLSSPGYSTVKGNEEVSPYASIYTDPLPLVKSEGPPVVTNKNIKPLHQLGVGLFGEVMLAKTVGLSNRYLGIGNSSDDTISMKVAVKMLKSSPSEEVRKAFEKEIKFMSRLKDDNVIKLLGICTTGTPFIMMEYMENGDLNSYLQTLKFTTESDKLPAANEITIHALVHISYQIARGMKYLASCNFVHRDLAARNVLVGVDFTVKIADFGMSQNLYSEYYCRVGGQKVLPIRWMACECFYGKFSVKTDVWAFGITLWEIFTLCQSLPYDDLNNHELIEDAVLGASRRILEQPAICPDNIYQIMKSCWRHEPSERETFSVLCDQLNEYYVSIL